MKPNTSEKLQTFDKTSRANSNRSDKKTVTIFKKAQMLHWKRRRYFVLFRLFAQVIVLVCLERSEQE